MGLSKFRPTSIEATLPDGRFYHYGVKKSFTYFGFATNKVHFMVSENYIKPIGNAKLSADYLQEGEREEVNILSFINQEDKLYILYAIRYPQRDEFSVYVNEVNENLVVQGSPILLRNYKDLKGKGFNVDLVKSEDKKTFLICRQFKGKPGERLGFEISVIDRSFNEQWYKSFQLSYLNRDMSGVDINIDNGGNLYLLGNKVEASPSRNKENSNGYFVLYYGWENTLLKISQVGLKPGVNFTAALEMAKGVRPLVVGLNMEKKVVKYFVDEVDTQTGVVDNVYSDIMPNELYEASKNMHNNDSWQISNLAILDNNTIMVSFEAMYAKISSRGTFTGYEALGAFILGLDEKGKQAFNHTIWKRQIGDTDFISLKLIPFENHVFVVYNDNPDNFKRKDGDKRFTPMINGKDVLANVLRIDSDGKVVKSVLTGNPQLENYAINLLQLQKLNERQFHTTMLKKKNAFNFEVREVLIDIK